MAENDGSPDKMEYEACGVVFYADPALLYDWALIEAVADLDGNRKDPFRLRKLAILLFGEAQWAQLLSDLAERDGGHAGINAVYEFVLTAFKAVTGGGEAKN